MLVQLRDVVQGKPWLQIAKIAGRDLETLLLGDGPSPPQPPAERFIDERGNTTNLNRQWGPMKKLASVVTRDSMIGAQRL